MTGLSIGLPAALFVTVLLAAIGGEMLVGAFPRGLPRVGYRANVVALLVVAALTVVAARGAPAWLPMAGVALAALIAGHVVGDLRARLERKRAALRSSAPLRPDTAHLTACWPRIFRVRKGNPAPAPERSSADGRYGGTGHTAPRSDDNRNLKRRENHGVAAIVHGRDYKTRSAPATTTTTTIPTTSAAKAVTPAASLKKHWDLFWRRTNGGDDEDDEEGVGHGKNGEGERREDVADRLHLNAPPPPPHAAKLPSQCVSSYQRPTAVRIHGRALTHAHTFAQTRTECPCGRARRRTTFPKRRTTRQHRRSSTSWKYCPTAPRSPTSDRPTISTSNLPPPPSPPLQTPPPHCNEPARCFVFRA